jgi:hypothetical protein
MQQLLLQLKTQITDKGCEVQFSKNGQATILNSKNPQHHNRNKHIDVRYHFIRKCSQDGLIELAYIPTTEMVADILTKALPQHKYEKHMVGMGMEQ